MNPIKHKGRRTDNGEWVEGYLTVEIIRNTDYYFIHINQEKIRINPFTVQPILEDNELKEFLESCLEAKNVDYEKINVSALDEPGHIQGGEKVEIYWKDEDYIDIGYVLLLPGMVEDEGDFAIHVPKTQCSGDSEWIHIIDLLDLELISKVKIFPINSTE